MPGRVRRVDLVAVLRLLGARFPGEFERLREGGGALGTVPAQPPDLATGIARKHTFRT